MAEKNSLWKNIRNKAKQNRESGATPGLVGEDENGIPYRPLGIPMEGYEWENRPKTKSTYDKSKSKKEVKSNSVPVNKQGLPYKNLREFTVSASALPKDYSEPRYVAERDASSTKVTPAMSTSGKEPRGYVDDGTVQAIKVALDIGQFTPAAPYAYGLSLPFTTYDVIQDLSSDKYNKAAIDALGFIPWAGATRTVRNIMNSVDLAADVAGDKVNYENLTTNPVKKAEGGYYPTQGPGKALFKGYAPGGFVDGEDDNKTGLSKGLGYIPPTRQDSLNVYNYAINQDRHYKKLEPFVKRVDGPYVTKKEYDKIIKKIEKANPDLVKYSNLPESQKKLIRNNNNPNLVYGLGETNMDNNYSKELLNMGDKRIKPQKFIHYEQDPAYIKLLTENNINPNSYPVFSDLALGKPVNPASIAATKNAFLKKFPNITENQLWTAIYKQAKSKSVMPQWNTGRIYYDPIAIAPADILTPEQLAERLDKYGPEGIPQSYIDSQKNKSTNTNSKQDSSSKVQKQPITNKIIDRTPVQLENLESLRLRNLPTQETPLELNLKTPTPAKRKAAINRGANSGFDADGKPLVSEVNFGDGTGWHKVPYDTLDQYEEIKANGGYVNPYNQYAQGGYTNPYNQYQDDPYLNYANGGYMYGKGGRTWKNIGAGAYGALEGLVDTTFGWIPGVDMVTDMGYKALQKAGNSTADEIREQDSIHGYSQTAGAVTSAIVTGGATTGMAISEGAQGLGQGISKGNETSEVAKGIGTGLNIAGTVVGTAYNVSDAGKAATEGFKLSKAGSEGIGKFAAAAPKSAAAIKAANDTATAARLATTVDSAGNVIGATEKTIKGVDAAGNALSMKPGVLAPPIPSAPSVSSLAPNLPAAATTASASLPTSLPSTSDYSKLSKIGDVASSLSALPKSQEPPPMAPPIAPTPLPAPQPQTDYNQFAVNPPTINTGLSNIDYDFSYSPNTVTFSQGGNMLNNSLNLRNTMRYKRFAQGGTFDQYGINMIPDSAGLHHESAYGGVPIGPDALAEGGEIKMDTGDGGQYIVSDQVDGAETQKDFMFSKGGKYKELNRTLADGMKQDLKKYSMGNLATSDRVKDNLRRPNDSWNSIDQVKKRWQQKTEYARQRTQQDQAIAQAEEQKKMAEEQYIAAYGGRINPKKYPGLNMTKKAKGGYVYNPMTQPMLATGGPVYGNPASEYTYAMGGMYGDPYARGGQIDYTNDMYSSYAGGGPMVSNVNQPFNGPTAQNRGGMYIYPDGGMMPPEQQMMQEQQMQQQAPQEEMQQQPSQEQMMQMVQQAAQMLEQGAQPEQVMQQLVQAGVPQDMAMQAVQMAMQEMQGQMQQQGQEQPMQGQEQMMTPQGMAHGGTMYPGGGKTKPPVKKYYTNRAAYDKHYAGYRDTVDTRTNIAAIEAALAAQKFASKADFSQKMHDKYDTATASGKINKNLLKNSPDKTKLVHTDKSVTDYQKGTSPTEKTIPVYIPPPPPPPRVIHQMEELKPLEVDLSNKDVPTINSQLEELPASVKMPTPKNVGFHTVNDSTQGVLAEDNPAFNYNPGWEVNFGDNQGWEKINNKESYTDPETKEVFPSKLHYLRANSDQYNITGEGVPKSVNDWNQRWLGGEFDRNPVFPSDRPRTQATGGMMSPQDGMASQVAQQLQQGAQPQQVLQKLVEQGMPQEQAMAMVQAVMGQLQNQMQQQPQQQQQMMPQEQMAPQQPMMARGGYFNGRKQYKNAGPVGLSPLADESTMTQIAGLGQSIAPALTSAYAFNNLSKRKLTPSLVSGVNIDYTPERVNMMEESRRNLASGLNAMKGVAPTSSSYMGNVRGTILDANKLSGEQISKSWQDQKNEQAKYDYQTGTTNAGIKNKINESNEEMYQNAMQVGFEAAGTTGKNLASYYAGKENRDLQRWQAMNTSGEDWHWTSKGKAFRNKEGVWSIDGVPVDPSSGNPIK